MRFQKYPDDIIAHFYTKIFGRSLSKHDGDQGSENVTWNELCSWLRLAQLINVGEFSYSWPYSR